MATGPTIVTGAGGFAGRHLIARLAGRTELFGWHRAGNRPPAEPGGVVWREMDVTDRDAVRDAIEAARPARIYHLAGAPQVASSWASVVPHLRTNVIGTYLLLDAVRDVAPTCRVLVVSSAQVYQPSDDPIDEDAPLIPPNPYGLSKLAQDQLARRAARDDGLDVVLARPFNHTGPGQRPAYAVPTFARQVARIEAGLDPPTLSVGNLDARRDITDVRDVVEAYERVMDEAPAGRPYNVCSGRAWRIGDLLDELLHQARVAIDVAVDPDKLRPNDISVVQGDATRIRGELEWTPQIAVEQTLGDTLAWWRSQLEAD